MAQQLLLADDSIAIQEVVEASLAKQGFKITSVISGRSVIQEARQIDPDIILVNSILLDEDGYEVCEEIKKDSELKDIPVLLLIGESEQYDEQRGLNSGIDDFLSKPL